MDHIKGKLKMWKDGILRVVLFLVVAAGSVECQPWLRQPHPLCVSQFALANRACIHLPIYTLPPPPGPPPAPLSPPPAPGPPSPVSPEPIPPTPEAPDPDDRARAPHHRHRGGNNDHDHDHDGDHHHRHRGGNDNDDHGHHGHGDSTRNHHHHENAPEHDDHNNRRHHHHHHDHDRRRVQEETEDGTPVEQECCHWLEQVDTDCVCDVLVNLPPFLSKPLHEYTVLVDHVCNVTFACPSRIRL